MLSAVDVRRRRLLGGASVVLGVVLITLAIMAMTGYLGSTTKKEASDDGAATSASQSADTGSATASDGSDQTATDSATEPSTDTTTEAPAAQQLPLTVLNGGGIAGLAAAGQTAFEAQQWPVSEIGNYTGEPPEQSTVYYPADDAESKASAELLVSQFPQLVAAEMPEGFGYTGLVVVLTGDWQPGD